MGDFFLPRNLDIASILKELSSLGATSTKILDEDSRVALLKEAQDYNYEPEDEVVGSGYILLKNSFQDLLEQRLAQSGTYPFEMALSFNSIVLQRYEEGSIGITPHKDGLSYINLVCVFVIGGQGSFYVCSDRSGKDSIEIDASPGNVILMRAPGFLGCEDERPCHYVTDVRESRYTFGLRQKRV